jgi:hypothetical protein
MQIEANAVIEAYQERVKHLTHELMLAQAYIAAQSTVIKELEPKTGYAHEDKAEANVEDATDDILYEQVPEKTIRMRAARALEASTRWPSGFSTIIEAILVGQYDRLSDEEFRGVYETWEKHERANWTTVRIEDAP